MSNVLISRVVLRSRHNPICSYCANSKDPKDITDTKDSKEAKDITDTLGPPTKLWRYISTKFFNIVEKYENKLEKKAPKAFNAYKTLKSVKFIAADTKVYMTVTKDMWEGRELHTFSRRELEIYQDMPQDMWKISTLLVLVALPVIGNAFVLIGYMFPKRLLTHHLWNDAQKAEFGQFYHTYKLSHYHNLLEHLDKLVHKNTHGDLKTKMMAILQKLQTSSHPTAEELLQVKPFFSQSPLQVEELPQLYIRQLAKLYGYTERRYHLREDALILLHLDRAMVREGIENMSDHDMCKACLKRGLNPYGIEKEERIKFLTTWTNISRELDVTNVSLLLHSSVFLTYNQKTNINLMKGKRYKWKRKQSA